MPRALALGTLAVIAIYCPAERCCFCTCFPSVELAQGQGSVLDVVADGLLGVRAGDIMGVGVDHQPRGEHQRDDVCRSARLLRDGPGRSVLPARGARFTRAIQTPAIAIIAQAVWSGLLVLSGGANALTTYTGFCRGAVRRRRGRVAVRPAPAEPNAPRPFKAWGYPFAPGIFAIASAGDRRQCALDAISIVPIQSRHGLGSVRLRIDHHRPGHSALLLLLPESSTSARRSRVVRPRQLGP